VAVPVFGLQWALKSVFPEHIAPDPIPLLLFASVLGFLYFRTHRIVPSIVLHMALNGTTMAMTLLAA
jgi:membrane protease YdiL (CAAX protease family)